MLLNAVPLIVTEVPTAPLIGVNPLMEIWLDRLREIDRRLPTES